MALGTRTRMWTRDEYAKKYDELQAENDKLREAVEIVCSFCKDSGFDLIGLKHHLITYCRASANLFDDKP